MVKTLIRLAYLQSQCLRHHHFAWAEAIAQRITERRHA